MSLTIYDISEKAGVSIATVSRVLNNSSKVKESTRKKIMDIIDEYDYTPNSSAREIHEDHRYPLCRLLRHISGKGCILSGAESAVQRI